jgi:hypothetical protein
MPPTTLTTIPKTIPKMTMISDLPYGLSPVLMVQLSDWSVWVFGRGARGVMHHLDTIVLHKPFVICSGGFA